MIPKDFITEWRQFAPWLLDAQIEQDLIISRVLAEMFAHPLIQPAFAFRGGTALYKLHLLPPARYSEDIDLVQITPEPIGSLVSAIRTLLDSWLGAPNRAFKENGVTLTYRFVSETLPPIPLKLKIEINSREHLAVFGLLPKTLTIKSRWFTGQATLLTYCLEELLATKLRALYQRRKGRDLFDLWLGLTQGQADPQQILTAFHLYL